jgi:hypothetical protein
MGGTCSTRGRNEKCIQYFGNRPLGRPRRRWEYNVRMVLREIPWEGVDWIHLTQAMDQGRALVNTVMNLRVP